MAKTSPAAPTPKVTTVDDYLARRSPAERKALEQLRKTIHAAAPGAEEVVSYGLPGVRHNGRMLVWFGAHARHCAFYPGAVVQSLGIDLEKYDTAKGTIRFQPEAPLPAALVRKIVRARIASRTPKASAGRQGSRSRR